MMAASALEIDFLFIAAPTLLSMDDDAILNSLLFIQKHNLNSTDAAILSIFQRYLSAQGNPSAVLVAADQRLLRAANAEGFGTINPETFPTHDIPAFLASL